MKILKRILALLVIVIGGALIAALFTKKDYSVIREITIEQPKDSVFKYIKYLKNQNNYSKWAMMDPAMTKTFRGTDGTVGFVSAWESKADSVGKGEQEIVGIRDGDRIDYELRFLEPFESTSKAYMTTSAVQDSQTVVKWGFDGHMAYPTNIMCWFMDFDTMIGNDLQKGLQNLKGVMEK